MSKYRLSIPALEDHAVALGYVIITWGYLQVAVTELLKALIPVRDNIKKNILTLNTAERDQLKIIAELAWYRLAVHTRDKDLYESLVTLLNKIDNDLRPKRNRYIHDVWISQSDGEPALQWDRRTRMVRIEGGNARHPVQTQQATISEEEIWEFVSFVQRATAELSQVQLRLPPAVE